MSTRVISGYTVLLAAKFRQGALYTNAHHEVAVEASSASTAKVLAVQAIRVRYAPRRVSVVIESVGPTAGEV